MIELKKLSKHQTKVLNERIERGFSGEHRYTAENGDKFAQDCNIYDGIVYFLYHDDHGIYESHEEPRLRMDFSGAPVSIGGWNYAVSPVLEGLKNGNG